MEQQMEVQENQHGPQQRRKRCCDVFFAPLLFSCARTGADTRVCPRSAADIGDLTTAPAGPENTSSCAAPAPESPLILTRAISFWCGNPAIERISGEIHYYLTPSSTSAARLLRQLRTAAAARQTRDFPSRAAHQVPMHLKPPADATRTAAASVEGAGNARAGGATVAATSTANSERAQSARNTIPRIAREPRSGSVLRGLWLEMCSCGFTAEDWLQERCLLLAPRIPSSLSPAEFCDLLSLRDGLVFEHAKVLHGPTTAEYLVLLYCTRYTALAAIASLGGRCLFVEDGYHAAPLCELRLVKHIRIYPATSAPFSNPNNSPATGTYSTKGQIVGSAPSTVEKNVVSSLVLRDALSSRSAASAESLSKDLSEARMECKNCNRTRVSGVYRVDGIRHVASGFGGSNSSSRAHAADNAAQARGTTDVEPLPATSARKASTTRLNTCGANKTHNVSNEGKVSDSATKKLEDREEATTRGIRFERHRGSLSQARKFSRGNSASRAASRGRTRSRCGNINSSKSSRGRSKTACQQLSHTAKSETGRSPVHSRRGSNGLAPGTWADGEAYWVLLRGQEEDAQQQQFCAVCLEHVVIPVAPSLAGTQYITSSHLRTRAGSILSATSAAAYADALGARIVSAVGEAAATRRTNEKGVRRRREFVEQINISLSDAACRFRTCSSRHRSTSRRCRSTYRTCRSCSTAKSSNAEHGVGESYCNSSAELFYGSAGARDGDLVANTQAAGTATPSLLPRKMAADDGSCSSGGHYSDSYNSSTPSVKESHESSAVYESSSCIQRDTNVFNGSCISETSESCNDGRMVGGGPNLSGSTGNGTVSNNSPTPGVVVTVLCGHSFHSSCLRAWNDASCPVCRYQQHPHQPWLCFVCGSAEGVRVCLLCGFVGCGDVLPSMPPAGVAGANPPVAQSLNSPIGGSDAADDADAAHADVPICASAAANTLAAGTQPAAPQSKAAPLIRYMPLSDGENPAGKGRAPVEGGAAVGGGAAVIAADGAELVAETPFMQRAAGFPLPGERKAAAAASEGEKLVLIEKAEAHEEESFRRCKDERINFSSEKEMANEDDGPHKEKEEGTQKDAAIGGDVSDQDLGEGDGSLWMPFSPYSAWRKRPPQHVQWKQGSPQRQTQQQQWQESQQEDHLDCVRKSAEAAALEKEHLWTKQPHFCERLRGRVKGHAQLHFEDTLHTYALELETDGVWDFLSGGYVQFMVQERCHAKAALLQQKIKDETAAVDVCSNVPSSGDSGGKGLVFSYCSCCGGEMFPAAASAELTVPTGVVGVVEESAPVLSDKGVEAGSEGEAEESVTLTQPVKQQSQEEKPQPHFETQLQGSEHEEQHQHLFKEQKGPQNLCGACRIIYAALEVQPREEPKPLSTAAAADTEDADSAEARQQCGKTTQQQLSQEGVRVFPAGTGDMYPGVGRLPSAESTAAASKETEITSTTVGGVALAGIPLDDSEHFRRDKTNIHGSSIVETAGGTCRVPRWRKVNGWITEFNQMLAACLDSQRDYYEEKIQRIVALYTRPVKECNEAAKEALQAVTELQAQVKRQGHALAALEIEAATLAAEGKRMATRHSVLLRLHEQLLQEAATARHLQEEEERRLGQAVQTRLAKIEDLQLQIREVSFHMQAVKQLADVPGVEESTMLVAQRPAALSKYTRGGGRRRHFYKVIPAQKAGISDESSSKNGTSSSACTSSSSVTSSNNNSSTHSNTGRSNTRGHAGSRRDRTRNSSGEKATNIMGSRYSKPGGGKKSTQTDRSSKCSN